MTTVDWVIIGIVVVSTLMSLWRGAGREIFSVITWVAAIYVGVKFATRLDGLFLHFIETQSVRFAAGFLVLFIIVMILGGLLGKLLSSFISFTGLTVVDRILGVLFGMARGVLILAVLVVLAKYTTIPNDAWWKTSKLLPYFDGIATDISAWVQRQGFDPKKIESWVDSVEGKAASGKANEPVSTHPGAVNPPEPNVLGVPVENKATTPVEPNMLGGHVESSEQQ